MRFTNLLTDEAALGELGERITRMRVERDWTQSDLAEAAGVSKSTIERLESGCSAQLSNLLRTLRALGALENFERLLPAGGPGPIELLERGGKTRQRVRASKAPPKSTSQWSWAE